MQSCCWSTCGVRRAWRGGALLRSPCASLAALLLPPLRASAAAAGIELGLALPAPAVLSALLQSGLLPGGLHSVLSDCQARAWLVQPEARHTEVVQQHNCQRHEPLQQGCEASSTAAVSDQTQSRLLSNQAASCSGSHCTHQLDSARPGLRQMACSAAPSAHMPSHTSALPAALAAMRGVVAVALGSGAWATGLVLSRDGLLVTNAHLFARSHPAQNHVQARVQPTTSTHMQKALLVHESVTVHASYRVCTCHSRLFVHQVADWQLGTQ